MHLQSGRSTRLVQLEILADCVWPVFDYTESFLPFSNGKSAIFFVNKKAAGLDKATPRLTKFDKNGQVLLLDDKVRPSV